MTNALRKAFGELNITWPKLIIWAVIAGLYTGLMAMLPAARDTSFADISISFEVWILFGILIIMNSKTAVESAAKCFVFFLISQPIVYLVQVPFNVMGWGIFVYYKGWFIWTLLTIPMGFIGWDIKKEKWWGLVILGAMMAFLGFHYMGFLREAFTYFPQHLLSAIFCAVTLVIYPFAIFRDEKIRKAGIIIAIIMLILFTAIAVMGGHNYYETDLLMSGESNPEFDDTCTAEFADPSYGDLSIEYEQGLETYKLHAVFKKQGETQFTLTDIEGNEYIYDLQIGRNTYNIKLADSDEWRY